MTDETQRIFNLLQTATKAIADSKNCCVAF